MMLHGIGTDPSVWDGWLPALVEHHEVVRPALLGLHGQTPPSPRREELLDAVIADVLRHMPSGRRAHLVGESTGGTVMLVIALRHPERVASLTLVNAPLRGGGQATTERWATLFAESQEAWSAEMMDARFAPDSLTPRTWSEFERRQRVTVPSAALALSGMLGDLNPAAELGGLQVGLLALLPSASPFIDPLLYEQLLMRAPDHELQVFRDARHGLVFSHAVACSELVREFLEQRELRSPSRVR